MAMFLTIFAVAAAEYTAGIIPIDINSGIFYWMFEKPHAPVVFWFSGGPGSSSLLATFSENGPWTISDDGTKVTENPYGWNTVATMVYVDQPVGTGYSYTNNLRTTREQYLKDFATFLDGFYKLYPHLVAYPLYLSGESYAGVYIPLFANYIIKHTSYHLEAIFVGNPFINLDDDTITQIAYGKALGFLSSSQELLLQKQLSLCLNASEGSVKQDSCNPIFDFIVGSTGTSARGNVNIYYALQNNDPNQGSTYPPNGNNIGVYLKQIQSDLHVNTTWICSSDAVENALYNDGGLYNNYLYEDLLQNSDVEIYIYNGVYDLVCNHMSNYRSLLSFSWPGQTGFASAVRSVWGSGNTTYGYYQMFDKLTYIVVSNSSHLVPYNQGANMLELLRHVLYGKPLDLVEQTIPFLQKRNSV